MLILLDKVTSGKDFKELARYLDNRGIEFFVWKDGMNRFVGMAGTLPQEDLERFPFIERVIEDYPPEIERLAEKRIEIKGRTISRDSFTVIAGPCTIDSREELYRTATALKELGIDFLRGGAYKLRSSPHSYQGIGKEGLLYMKEICTELDLVSVSEIISIEDLPLMLEYIDILTVGTRNMQNYRLLSALGETSKPVILKRGMACSIKEWVLASEYIARGGNKQIILCERGIRTFENSTRNTLDISAVPIVKKMTPYPVIIDPSHSSGRRELIKPLAWAAAGAGADGLIIECHHRPDRAKCDAQQKIDITQLKEILEKLPQITQLWSKKF
jgi:3-deoxy-7-phosphoheptulonate synthase